MAGPTVRAGSSCARWFLFGIAALVLPAQFLLGQTPDRWDGIRASLNRYMQERNVASVAVAVAQNGKIVWEEGFGWADRERRIPSSANTMYSLASISKPFTATGLLRLAEQGKIDLDRPANEYLGVGKLTGLAGDASGATVRRVMSHTAGLPLHYQFFYSNDGYSAPTMDETIARYGILVTPPGAVHEYSNLGYGILDYIITRGSGRDYNDFMRSEIFVPLGLTHTSVGIGPGLEDYVAVRYDSGGKPIPFYTFDHVGASAVYSSAHDLIRFGMFHLKDHLADQRPVLRDSTIADMQTIRTPPGSEREYALGWIVFPNDNGYVSFGHSGGMPGVATVLVLFPTENIAITVLSNDYRGPTFLAEDIAGVLLPKYAAGLKERRARRPPLPVPFSPSAELVGEWSGTLRTWSGTLPLTLTIKSDGEVLVKLGDQLTALLNEVRFKNGVLSGRFAGQIPTEDVLRHPHSIAVDLTLRNGKLAGQASAQTPEVPIVWYSLASYVELAKK